MLSLCRTRAAALRPRPDRSGGSRKEAQPLGQTEGPFLAVHP